MLYEAYILHLQNDTYQVRTERSVYFQGSLESCEAFLRGWNHVT